MLVFVLLSRQTEKIGHENFVDFDNGKIPNETSEKKENKKEKRKEKEKKKCF